VKDDPRSQAHGEVIARIIGMTQSENWRLHQMQVSLPNSRRLSFAVDASSSHPLRTKLLLQGLILTALTLLALAVLSASPASAATTEAHPSAPRRVTAIAGDNSTVVSFVAPSSNGGSRVTDYYVKEYGRSSAIRRCDSTRCSILGLSNGVRYRFAVAAVNRYGRSLYSAPSKFVTPIAPASTTTTTITFNANGGSGTMASETEPYDTTGTLTVNTFTYSGYTFTDWNTDANGSGTSYADGATYAFAASLTLYAQWSAVFLGTYSQNWSGYVLPSSTILTQAAAEWVVPHLNCVDTPNAQAGIWVGIGGATWPKGGTSGSLFQTGTANNCVNGVQEESAWFELFPYMSTYSLIFSDFPITAGDTILGKVGINTEGRWVAVLEDVTTGIQGVYEVGVGWDVSTIATNSLIVPLQQYGSGWSYSGGYSAEWIVEPGTSFANYGSESFTNLGTSIPSWSLTASDAQEIVQNGVILSVPSDVSGDSFTVNYTGP